MDWQQLSLFLDPYFIVPFRWLDNPVAAFYLGCAVLGAVCVVLGELSMSAAYLFNRKHFQEQTQEMVRMHNLSIEAIRSQDKENYKACNRWANEWFGKSFFARAALFAVSIWPVPFVLGWLDGRFGGIDIHSLPFISYKPGYPFAFIPLYIVIRILFSRLKPFLPFFARVQEAMKNEVDESEVRSWSELHVEAAKADEAAGEAADTAADADLDDGATKPASARPAAPTAEAPVAGGREEIRNGEAVDC